jgi:hypothetical protein
LFLPLFVPALFFLPLFVPAVACFLPLFVPAVVCSYRGLFLPWFVLPLLFLPLLFLPLLFLPLFVPAVILSAAKDPEELNAPKPSRPFSPYLLPLAVACSSSKTL